MCRTTPCLTCGKTTWAGCGEHVDSVMQTVPAAEQCTCGVQKPPAWSVPDRPRPGTD